MLCPPTCSQLKRHPDPPPDLPLPGENDVNALGPWEGALEHSSRSPLPVFLVA